MRFIIIFNKVLCMYVYSAVKSNKLPQYAPAPGTLTFDLLTLKVLSYSYV